MTKYTDDEFKKVVAASRSYAEALRALGLKPAGGNYKTIKDRINLLDLDTSHMTGQGWLRAGSHQHVPPVPLEKVLVENRRTNSNRLKLRLITEGLLLARCTKCGIEEWNGSAAPLELDHINGVSNDNRIENLRVLCPNCHAQTPTYRAKNIQG